jgi:glycolate oxidase FAD binding subunit
MSIVVSTLESLLSAKQIVSRECINDTLAEALNSTTEDDRLPEAVAYPSSEPELAEVMACAFENRWRVLPCGSGSKLAWGGLTSGFDLAISTQGLNQVIDHAVGDMTLTAGAGLKLSDLKPQLAQHQQFLAVDPAYPDQATLGGIVATGDTGALRQRYNGVRDMLIGISFVRYDGQVAKAGGRVVKNVAGYDLMKLMTGSYGSLGMISRVTFRLYPFPEAAKTVVISGGGKNIAKLVADLRQSSLTPTALDLLSPRLAAVLGFSQMTLAARFQANAPGVDEQVTMLSKMAPDAVSLRILEKEPETNFWERERSMLFSSTDDGGNNENGYGGNPPVIAKLGILPTRAIDLLTKLHEQFPQDGLVRIHGGSGIGILRLPADMATPAGLRTIRSWCETDQGYFTVLQAPKPIKKSLDVWGYSGNALPLMRRIKATFDPYNLLSSGRFVDGL